MYVSKRLIYILSSLEFNYRQILDGLVKNDFIMTDEIKRLMKSCIKLKHATKKEISKNLKNKFNLRILEVKEGSVVIEILEKTCLIDKDSYNIKLKNLFTDQGFLEIEILNLNEVDNEVCTKLELGFMTTLEDIEMFRKNGV